MTELVKEYGYASEGETFTIADPNEVWIMEMIGKGKEDKGAVWVARRVPDGYIAGHANHSRIHRFPLKDKTKQTLYSPDVIKFARAKGYFDGKDEDFSFHALMPPTIWALSVDATAVYGPSITVSRPIWTNTSRGCFAAKASRCHSG